MRSFDLSLEVADVIVACRDRIRGVGNQQYSIGDTQKFELMSLDDLILYAREEVQDIINYCVMLDIRFRRLQKALNLGFEAYREEYLKDE